MTEQEPTGATVDEVAGVGPAVPAEEISAISGDNGLTGTTDSSDNGCGETGESDVPYDKQLATLAEMLASEYKRGCEDTVARLMKAAGTPVPGRDATLPLTAPPGNMQRAPRGAARALIDRVLEKTSTGGSTTYGIQSGAETDFEKMVTMSAIRNELKNGERERRYRQVGGVWYLASRSPTMKAVG